MGSRMVSLHTFSSVGAETKTAIKSLEQNIAGTDIAPSFIYAFYGCDHDHAEVQGFLHDRFPGVPFLGGTSCGGVMDQVGLHGPQSIGLLLIEDPDGEYGVAACELGDDAANAGEAMLREALENAKCPGELPELIWIFQAPGREEDVIDGLRRVVGDTCPIIGGSAADNTVEGNWNQISPAGSFVDGLVVAALFPSGGISYAFQGGYEPAGPSGIATRIDFNATGTSGVVTRSSAREILEIDGQPAAATYNSWNNDLLGDKVATGGTILIDTTMRPIAVDAGEIEGIPQYLLIHPESVTKSGGLSTFASVEEGSRVYSMSGNRDRLIDRAARVAKEASEQLPNGRAQLAGGLMVYCAGCMLAVDEEMPAVADRVAQSFEGMPFLGCFTFGEQGKLVDHNVHGNLMISAIAFGA